VKGASSAGKKVTVPRPASPQSRRTDSKGAGGRRKRQGSVLGGPEGVKKATSKEKRVRVFAWYAGGATGKKKNP